MPASFAATSTVSILIDGDNNPATGCAVSTVNGAFAGVDRVLNTTIVADVTGYRTQSISLQSCNGSSLGGAQVIDSSVLPIARGNGVGGATAIETYVPSNFLPVAGQKLRLAVTTQGADGLAGSDALTADGAGTILVDGPPLLMVPTLATASLALTALLLVGSLWFARRRGWHGMQVVVVMIFAVSLSGQLLAAIVRDGLIADWTGIAPVAIDPVGDAPPGSDITRIYSTADNGNVFFRVDVVLNSPPVANAQTVTAIVSQPLALTLTGADFEASPLSFTVVTQPTQGVLTGTAPNLTYTANALATPSDSFTFKVNDGSVDSAAATVTIGNSRSPAITSANNVVFIPLQANTFAFASNGNPTPVASFGACSPALASVTFTADANGGGTLSGSPTVAEAGVHTCTFTSANGVAPNATQTFTLTVGGAAAITSVDTLSVPELAAFTHTVTTSSALPITAMTSAGALPTGATFTYAGAPAATATIGGTPAVCTRGSYPVTLGVSNAVASSNQSFNLTVRPVNQAPSFTKGADVTVLEDTTAHTVAGWATARSTGAACESGQTLSFEIVNNSNAALFSSAPAVSGTNGDLTFTPAANANGSATITLRIKDNGGTADSGVDTSATQSFVINVTAVNDAPSFVKGADITVLQNAAAQTVAPWATAISAGPADEAAQPLTFQIVSNSNAGMFSAGPAISPTGTLTFTPATNQPGTATITVNLKDNGGVANGGSDTSANQTFVITVSAVNAAPSFVKGADQTVNDFDPAQTVNPWATAISAGPANESGQTVSFNVTGNTNPALFSAAPAVSPAGVLTYAPAANANGVATISVTLQDNGGTANGGVDTSAAQTFTITVVRPPPVISSLTPSSGPSAGGNTVVLNGTGFDQVTTVEIGGIPVAFTQVSNTRIDVIAPAGSGAVSVGLNGSPMLLYGYDLTVAAGPHTLNTTTDLFDGAPIAGLANGTWNVGNFTLAAGATVTVTGTRPLVINSTNTVVINGSILAVGGNGANATNTVPGAGGLAGPGGFAGGRGGDAVPNGALPGQGPGGGGNGIGTPVNSLGGGGGGHLVAGASTTGPLGTIAGGPAYGAANDVPNVLTGGSGGGGGGRSSGAFTQGGGGGGGGGVIRIIARNTLTLGATAVLDVHGGNGGNGNTPPSGNGASGGGGGSGGSIWLSASVAPTIDVAANLLLAGGTGGKLIITGAPFTATDGGLGAVGTLVVQP